MMFGISVFAQDKPFSFHVATNQNNGGAYSSANPKNDNEQNSYIFTTSHNLVSGDMYWYNVRKSASTSGISMTNYLRCTPSNASRIVAPFNQGYSAGAGTKLYLEADTDKYTVDADGHWIS